MLTGLCSFFECIPLQIATSYLKDTGGCIPERQNEKSGCLNGAPAVEDACGFGDVLV